MTTLAILIPTIANVERRKLLARLMNILRPQVAAAGGRAVVIPFEDKGEEDGGKTTGAKRQSLMESADSEFVCHVDDDDLVHPNYVAEILNAIDAGADVVGFRLRCYEDGMLTGEALHSLAVDKWGERKHENGLTFYTRTPNHLNPIRRSIALQVGFKSITVGEDADYATRLYERFGATMREVFIDKYLYQYLYRTQRERTLIKMYEDDGRMTRAGMEETIKKGGSVMVNGQTLTRLEQLPCA